MGGNWYVAFNRAPLVQGALILLEGIMVGHLKAAGVIAQCTRCYALRNLRDESKACPTCRALLNEIQTEVRWLSLNEPSSDEAQPEAIGINDLAARLVVN